MVLFQIIELDEFDNEQSPFILIRCTGTSLVKLLMLGLHWDHAFHALHVLEKREGHRGSCDQSGMILVERA